MNKRNLTQHEPLPAGDTTHITEFEAAKAGRNLVVNEYKERIATVWDHWPKAWRRSILQAVDFTHTKQQAAHMALFSWEHFGEVERNMIANGIIRICQIRNFVAASLVPAFDKKIEQQNEQAAV